MNHPEHFYASFLKNPVPATLRKEINQIPEYLHFERTRKFDWRASGKLRVLVDLLTEW